ncbi:MAG: carbon starvation protein A [Planctomycetales bacterium]|nr:carbon starvation protein A [Planctomycetales bacterium]
MNLLTIVVASAAFLLVAYYTYGPLLARLLRLDPNKATPAVELRDNVDFEPIETKFLLSQHFSAIAAAGPIVGPILAGVAFGWVPALIWILIGCVFIGGVHDLTSLTASIRHKARSIAEVVRDHMSQRSYLLFLTFVWIALVYIIVAFTDLTATAFLGQRVLENGKVVSGGGIATSSLMYLVLPIVMGWLLRYTKLSIGWATVIFLPLVGVSIWAGQLLPFDLESVLGVSRDNARRIWDVLLLIYCLVAAVVPMWLLLQPRGHLGGYFLYIALAGGALGLILGGEPIRYHDFTGFVSPEMQGQSLSLFPMLFIMIACGACSGFHSLICSGTTSKQLARETDAKAIGYGAMLLEGMVAVVSLCCVMKLAPDSKVLFNAAGQLDPTPNLIYALGIGSFLEVLGIPPQYGVSFALMAFTTFIYDTLDVCTRLGRYIIQELTGWHNRFGRWVGTSLTAAAPLFFLLQPGVDASGKPLPPVWKVFWNLFGASNQLLAALTFLGVTVWLWRTYRARWVLFVTGIPTVLMYVMSTWALVAMTLPKFWDAVGVFQAPRDPVPWIGVVLLSLAALMLIEAIRVLVGPLPQPPAPKPKGVPATA